MQCLNILAQAANADTQDLNIVPVDWIWEQIIALTWLQAVLAILFGVVYLLYGWRIFKVLVVIAFGLIGLFIGIQIGPKFGSVIWSAVIGLLLFAAISIPLMRWAVSILGAIAGGIVTGGIWYACGLPEQYILAGIAIGLVAGGMISFIVFKIAVMLFTSLGGGILIVTGMLSLLYQYESIQQPATETIKELVYQQNWFLPVAMIIPTIVGFIVQKVLIKNSADWSI